MKVFEGPGLIFGDCVNTDELHPSTFYSLRPETVRAGFARHVSGHEDTSSRDLRGAIVVAGRTFGIGSSRETGARVFRLAGIQAVVAESFARIFQRNLLNLGVPALECPGLARILRSHRPARLRVVMDRGGGTLEWEEMRLELSPLDPFWWDVLDSGGLLDWMGVPVSRA